MEIQNINDPVIENCFDSFIKSSYKTSKEKARLDYYGRRNRYFAFSNKGQLWARSIGELWEWYLEAETGIEHFNYRVNEPIIRRVEKDFKELIVLNGNRYSIYSKAKGRSIKSQCSLSLWKRYLACEAGVKG